MKMKVEFKNKTLKQIYYNQKIGVYPQYIEDKFVYLVNYIMDSESLQDLYQWKSLHLEKLQGKEYKNKHSIRVNDQRRLIIEIIVEPELTTIIVIKFILNKYIKMTKKVEGIPVAFHPGKYIEEELKERKISQKDFSDILGINKSELNNLIKGRRNITPKIAMRLAKAFGTSEKLRLNLQNRYDIYLLQTDKSEMKAIYDIGVRLEKYHPVFA